MSDIPEVLTSETARRMLGGDKPISEDTLARMVRDGVIEQRGAGRLRRYTAASIEAYLKGERVWQRSSDATRAKARSGKTSTGSGGRKRSAATGAGGLVLLAGRTPKPKP